MTDAELLTEIYYLCQRHNHPGVSLAVHDLANRIVKMIEKHDRDEKRAKERDEGGE